ncbi:MAG: phosphate acyltransferase, partial [Cellvibrionaceae bacterium]|nr:phosphate acyltransferase [Cellvibrionaceae bacterium]
MSKSIRLAVDAMGGDLGPRVALSAAYQVAAANADAEIDLYGQFAAMAGCLPADIQLPLDTHSHSHRLANGAVLHLHHADAVVTMADKPAQALRHKKDSSMWQAVDAVRTEKAQACVSAGNTGALMAMGRHLLKTFPGVDRPAIAKLIPTAAADCLMLDLGASVKCDTEHLVQNAVMGSVFMQAVAGVDSPRVALLNIGLEEIKGNEQIRLAAASLQANDSI